MVLRDVADLDYAEIAATLDVPIGTVRSRIARGRAALAVALGNPTPPPTSKASTMADSPPTRLRPRHRAQRRARRRARRVRGRARRPGRRRSGPRSTSRAAVARRPELAGARGALAPSRASGALDDVTPAPAARRRRRRRPASRARRPEPRLAPAAGPRRPSSSSCSAGSRDHPETRAAGGSAKSTRAVARPLRRPVTSATSARSIRSEIGAARGHRALRRNGANRLRPRDGAAKPADAAGPTRGRRAGQRSTAARRPVRRQGTIGSAARHLQGRPAVVLGIEPRTDDRVRRRRRRLQPGPLLRSR